MPAYPLWGGSALVGMDGTLLGIGSLLVQEALGPGSPAFPGNMYVPINRLKPIFKELVDNGRLLTPPRPWLGLYTVEHMGQLVVGGISEGGPPIAPVSSAATSSKRSTARCWKRSGTSTAR